jgi:hypothetical protein
MALLSIVAKRTLLWIAMAFSPDAEVVGSHKEVRGRTPNFFIFEPNNEL